jgi:hypothetical protein
MRACLDGRLWQREVGALSIAVHVLFQIGGQILKNQIQARLVVLLDVLDAQQPATAAHAWCARSGVCKQSWAPPPPRIIDIITHKHMKRIAAHLTMWLLSLSIFSNEISRRVVLGTPSSSICIRMQAGGSAGGHATAQASGACRAATTAPPSASSSEQQASPSFGPWPCTPCRTCPPRSFRASHNSPCALMLPQVE